MLAELEGKMPELEKIKGSSLNIQKIHQFLEANRNHKVFLFLFQTLKKQTQVPPIPTAQLETVSKFVLSTIANSCM
jgi:hypothetical protein